MKKLFILALSGWLCGAAFAQSNPAPAQNPPAANAQTPAAPQSAPSAQTQPTAGSTGNNNALYTDRIPPEQIIALDANGNKFQARHIADLSGQPRGAVIILHDSGQHPSWPFTAAALIDDLPLHGWDTLNIELPAPAIDSEAQARITAAIKYYADQNQRNIALIGFGSGAIRAAENLRLITAATPNNTAPLTALVMIAPQQQLNGIDMDLPKLLPLTGIAALDMMLDNDAQARADAEARRRAVLHQRSRIYTRLELPPLNNASDPQHSAMVKRVRSWLQKNAHEPQKPGEAKSQTAPAR